MTHCPAPDALPMEKANRLTTMHAREAVAAAHGEEEHAMLNRPRGRKDALGANAARCLQ